MLCVFKSNLGVHHKIISIISGLLVIRDHFAIQDHTEVADMQPAAPDKIKSASKNRKTVTDKMLSVPRQLPALMRACKVQEKAAKVGFDWPDEEGALQKFEEETGELRAAVQNKDATNTEEELGDLLFSVVNAARLLSVDPEEALTKATDKFLNRFSVVEKLAGERGITMENTPLPELDKLWDEAKATLESK